MAKYLFFSLVCIAIISSPWAGYSQEEDVEYGYGTVVEVKKDSNEIVISEYDWEADSEVAVTYSVSPNVEIENIDSWKNIPIGVYVDIEYTIDASGKRIASYISVYKTEPAESETGNIEEETEEIEEETEEIEQTEEEAVEME